MFYMSYILLYVLKIIRRLKIIANYLSYSFASRNNITFSLMGTLLLVICNIIWDLKSASEGREHAEWKA